MRKARKLVLLIVAALAATAAMAAPASAVPSPNGDYEQDNWKRVSVKAFHVGNNNWQTCPATTYITNPEMWCKKDSGSFTWRTQITDGTGNGTIDWNCIGAALRFHLAADGTTLIGNGTPWYNPGYYSDFCSRYYPVSYATAPEEQTALTGQICKHIPTGTFYIGQGLVTKGRLAATSTLYWNSFARLTGNPYYFSPTGTYPLGTGLQTAHLAVGSPTAYQTMDGAPGTLASGVRQYFEFPFHNTLLTPNTTPCGWAGLT
jgi:hypothetical protein